MPKAEFTISDLEALRKRGEKLEKPRKAMSFRELVFELYPTIKKAIDSGLTRQEVYEQLLTDEMRQRIAPVTFMNYYHAAKREAEKGTPSGAVPRRKGGKGSGQGAGKSQDRVETEESGTETGDSD